MVTDERSSVHRSGDTLDIDIVEELEPFLLPMRYKVAYGGRGSSKSWGIARLIIARCIMKMERVLCCREFQQSISASVIQLLSDQISYMGLNEAFDVQAKAIYCKHNGSSIKFAGLAHNVSSIKSMEGLTIVWVEEAHNVTKLSWDTLIPTIRTPGSEIWVSFNPDDELDETYMRFVEETPSNAYITKINYDQNPWFPAVLEEERLDCLAKSEANHRHIWLGYPREIVEGAYWATEISLAKQEGRITKVAHDPRLPVMTSFDLGMGNATVVWFFQETPGSIRVIDLEVYKRTKIADIIRSPLREDDKRGLLDKPYRYSQHIFPHDVRVQEQGTGLSRKEMYENLGIEVTVAPGPSEISRDDGIEAVSMMLPKMWFDRGKCAPGLKALRRYQTEYNPAKKVFSKAPLHDWTSDYADSMRYFAITPHEHEFNTWGESIDYSRSNIQVI